MKETKLANTAWKYKLACQMVLENQLTNRFSTTRNEMFYFLYVGSIRKDLPQFLSLALILTDCLVAVRLKVTFYSWSDHGRSKAVRLDEQAVGEHTLFA